MSWSQRAAFRLSVQGNSIHSLCLDCGSKHPSSNYYRKRCDDSIPCLPKRALYSGQLQKRVTTLSRCGFCACKFSYAPSPATLLQYLENDRRLTVRFRLPPEFPESNQG